MDAAALKDYLGKGQTGTYILCLRLAHSRKITVGKLGCYNFHKGFYYYVGSAFGPGGIAARCTHHISSSPRPRWHIDYLRQHGTLTTIYYSTEGHHYEHEWAQHLSSLLSMPVIHFGASDCGCHSHLLYSHKPVDLKAIFQNLSLYCPQ